jgi:hypothetical protein
MLLSELDVILLSVIYQIISATYSMIPIAVLQCYDAVPNNRDFSFGFLGIENKFKKATNDASVRILITTVCVENIQCTGYFYDSSK